MNDATVDKLDLSIVYCTLHSVELIHRSESATRKRSNARHVGRCSSWRYELTWISISSTLGGLGLLLLGMGLLTDGLRRAAGESLHRLLGSWTRTRLRGLAAGTLITAVVQSSSAVTVAIIGFANAGLLTLPQAAWVVFGSNVGTTMTGWLVALIGLKIKVEALALPFIGSGMILRLIRPDSRFGGLGEALAGFGTLFVGLDLLKNTFSEIRSAVDLSSLEGLGIAGIAAGVGMGALVTTLMQSSSAAMAVILTARVEGILSPTLAAALVIGANLGTTSTALLSTLGATANARRVAVLHVVFNLFTGAVALGLLDPMVTGIERLHELASAGPSPAADLALFHTGFNLIGLILMWPLSGFVVRFLEKRFRSAEEDAARPVHLDNNVLSVPDLAVRALALELGRGGGMALGLARAVVKREINDTASFGGQARSVRRLLVSIAEYATRLSRTSLPPRVAKALTSLLRAHEHQWTMIRICSDLVGLRGENDTVARSDQELLSDNYLARVRAVLESSDTTRSSFNLEVCGDANEVQEDARRKERERLVELGSSGRASLPAINQALQELAHHRRIVSRAWKLAATQNSVRVGLDDPPPQASRSLNTVQAL